MQVFIDEAQVRKEDMEKMQRMEKSSLAKSLAWLAQRVQLIWVSLSTSDLLDNSDGPAFSPLPPPPPMASFFQVPNMQVTFGNALPGPPSFSDLTDHLNKHCCSYRMRQLGFTMRNSANIASAAHPDTMKGYYKTNASWNASVLPPGKRSTVAGCRPHCILAPWKSGGAGAGLCDYQATKKSISYAFTHLLPLTSHTVIQCGPSISPRDVAANLKRSVTLYDGGVRLYSNDGTPSLLPSSERYDQRPDLERWLTTGGLLVTHDKLFRGMEAPSVIYVTGTLGFDPGARGGLMRAVAALVVISDSAQAQEEKIRKTFDVIKL